jgi:hypothetical protein
MSTSPISEPGEAEGQRQARVTERSGDPMTRGDYSGNFAETKRVALASDPP